MTTTPTSRSSVNAKTIVIWTLRVLLGALFLMAAAMKLSGQPMMIAEFDQVGLGQWFRYFTGALEAAGAIAVLIPRFSIIGAGLLLLVDAGAFVAQTAVLHMDWIHTVIVGVIIVSLILLQRRRPNATAVAA